MEDDQFGSIHTFFCQRWLADLHSILFAYSKNSIQCNNVHMKNDRRSSRDRILAGRRSTCSEARRGRTSAGQRARGLPDGTGNQGLCWPAALTGRFLQPLASFLNPLFRVRPSLWLALCLLAQVCLLGPVRADPLFDTTTPISFFTNVASRLLSSELNLNLGQLQVYPTNQYTPAVHRLLQVTANILDAQNTNFYPSVFRPLFSEDAASNIFIIGYQQVTNVSGPTDPQLATPHAVQELLNFSSNTAPIVDANGPVNVYGVPWVLGAKQGLPNFNQLSLISVVQVTRKLEVLRTALDPSIAAYATNQLYILAVSNNLGVTFWNSYSNNYPRPLTVNVSGQLYMSLTNQNPRNGLAASFNYGTSPGGVNVSSWPGSRWIGVPPNRQPQSSSFLPLSWSFLFLSPEAYDTRAHSWDPSGQWPVSTGLAQLDQFGLMITNYFQALILDGSNVIDYVQIYSPTASGDLNQALADPDFTNGAPFYQWSTNSLQDAPLTPHGVINQLMVSGDPQKAPAGGLWSTTPTPMGITTPAAEAAYFNGFFAPAFQFNAQEYVNRNSVQAVPYTPSRTVYTAFLLQANDPLVHYLASDLDSEYGSVAMWIGKQACRNGVWAHSDDLLDQPLPSPPLSPIGGRYQPWGQAGQMQSVAAVDFNLYNLAYKDPLVWGPDYWNFPTGQTWNLSWLGQVHRGTPWQSIFLKSTNILAYSQSVVSTQSAGSNTWAAWTGDLQPDPQTGQFPDAANSAPVTDWRLVSLLAMMLNTNDLRTQFPVNNPDPKAWAVQFDGITALTNLGPVIMGNTIVPEFNTIVISSNSAQASIIASAIQMAKAGALNQRFQGIGDMLATPQLSILSPFLNSSSLIEWRDGISDEAYEVIPSQLLPLLRVDAIGKMDSTNGQIQAQFSGYDGHAYAIQISPDLLNWSSFSTNSPTNGVFSLVIPTMGNLTSQFYRTVLIH